MTSAADVAAFLDDLLDVPGFPDYAQACNGLQLEHGGPVRRVATAVDFSRRTIDAAVSAGANFLVLHHGMFWATSPRLVGPAYRRLRCLVEHDIAVYAVHLPLDAHERVGNCALLARALGLQHSARFLEFQGAPIGVAGETNTPTAELVARADAFAAGLGGRARTSHLSDGQQTRRWAVVTGAGADAASLALAAERGIDTLFVGEGPHHTTVDAPEAGCTVVYAGHYATETLGVQALAAEIHSRFGLPASFLFLPTGS